MNKVKQENRYFVIMCYKRLYLLGRISGRGIERHNELVREYLSELSNYYKASAHIKPIPMTNSIRREIKSNKKVEKFLIRQKYERLEAEMIDHYPEACISRHNRRVVLRYKQLFDSRTKNILDL